MWAAEGVSNENGQLLLPQVFKYLSFTSEWDIAPVIGSFADGGSLNIANS